MSKTDVIIWLATWLLFLVKRILVTKDIILQHKNSNQDKKS